MIKLFISILSSFLLSAAALAEPFVSPLECMQIATTLATVAEYRDNGIDQDKLLADVDATFEADSPPLKFYKFWVKTIYASKITSREMAYKFHTDCIKANGDVAKLYGSEV